MAVQFSMRSMELKDISRIQEIIKLSFSRVMGFFAFHSISEEGQVLVNQAEGAVAGFTKLIEFKIGGGKYGCILWIAVHPNFRRQRVATALTVEGLRRLKKEGASAVFASTQRRNSAALALLVRNGFQRIGFMRLRRLFGWRVLQFYSNIWLAPGEVVLINCCQLFFCVIFGGLSQS